MIEIVAGIIEDGETPESLVQREMLEEAGLTTLELEPMATILTSPGGASETVHFFCARIDSSDAGGLFGLDHEGEDIRAFVVPGDDVADLLTSGQVENGPAVLALQWFLLNRDRLRQQWAPSAR